MIQRSHAGQAKNGIWIKVTRCIRFAIETKTTLRARATMIVVCSRVSLGCRLCPVPGLL